MTLQIFCFQGMQRYTTGLQVALAYTKEEAIEMIVAQYEKDQKTNDPTFHDGTWYPYDCHQDLERKGLLTEKEYKDLCVDNYNPGELLRRHLKSEEVMILPVEYGTVMYCGGGD